MGKPCVGVLALQGAFREHAASVARLGAETREVRQLKDMDGIDAMIIPGGESTTMGKLLVEWGMLDPLRQRIENGMPGIGSWAGRERDRRVLVNPAPPPLGVVVAVVGRHGLGRQVDSFETELDIPELGQPPIPAVFIRAPVLTGVGPQARVLAQVNGQAVAVRQDNVLATSFHPELTPDTRLHRYFLEMCGN